MAAPEINAFLTHLAVREKVSASTQNQALSALLFLYRHVLGREVGNLGAVIRARTPRHLPIVMTREEVKAVLRCLDGSKWVMASLMYGAGLRLMECLWLRVQDIEFARNEILIRDGKARGSATFGWNAALRSVCDMLTGTAVLCFCMDPYTHCWAQQSTDKARKSGSFRVWKKGVSAE